MAENNNSILNVDPTAVLVKLHIIASLNATKYIQEKLRTDFQPIHSDLLGTSGSFLGRDSICFYNSGIVGMTELNSIDNELNKVDVNRALLGSKISELADAMTFDTSNKSMTYEIGFHYFNSFNLQGYDGLTTASDADKQQDILKCFGQAKTQAQKVLAKYVACFAGLHKAKNVEESDIQAILINPKHIKISKMEYKNFNIVGTPIAQLDTKVDLTNQLVFKMKYKLDLVSV